VDTHADAYARIGLMTSHLRRRSITHQDLKFETEGVVMNALAAEARMSPEQTSLLTDTDVALVTALEKIIHKDAPTAAMFLEALP